MPGNIKFQRKLKQYELTIEWASNIGIIHGKRRNQRKKRKFSYRFCKPLCISPFLEFRKLLNDILIEKLTIDGFWTFLVLITLISPTLRLNLMFKIIFYFDANDLKKKPRTKQKSSVKFLRVLNYRDFATLCSCKANNCTMLMRVYWPFTENLWESDEMFWIRHAKILSGNFNEI